MINKLLTVCCLLFTVSTAFAEVKEFTLTVTEGTIDLNGVQQMVWKYNGTVPGPIIRVKEGDTVKIKLKNTSGAKHGLFFHGLHVPAAVSHQEEVPVDPGYEYTYEFTAKPSGTHLYHCSWNMAAHLGMGLFGAIIVEGKNDEKFDKEYVYILNDWSSKAAKGEGHHEMGHPMTLMDNDITTINDIVVKGDNPVAIEVKKGEKVKLRLANIGHLPQTLRFRDGFALTHEDGYAVPKPEKKNELVIYPGKRYDITVTADKIGKFPFYQSINLPKGTREKLMESAAAQQQHQDAGHNNGHSKGGHSKDGGDAPHLGKEVPILMFNVKGGRLQ